jgi:RNA polymerase sigma factor (TIGR02999 family)
MDKDVTSLLLALSRGDRSKVEDLKKVLDEDLRSLASRFLSRESAGAPFQATDLVKESFLKLVDQTRITWTGKTHFMAVSAQPMRRILVDHARAKPGGGRDRVKIALEDDQAISFDQPEEILAVDEALTKLAALDETHARILECRLFGGMQFAEIAEALGTSSRTVELHWSMIRAWLLKQLDQA